MKMRIMMMTLFCIIVSLTVAGNAKEVLFEDYFEGDSLGDHWNVVTDRSCEPIELNVDYYVKDGNLVVDSQIPLRGAYLDAYLDLEGYSFTGDFTVEIKFKFSSESPGGPSNFALWLRRPKDPDTSWFNLAGHYIAFRLPGQDINFIEVLAEDTNIGNVMPLNDMLQGRAIYDEWFVLKIVSKDNVHFVYLDEVDVTYLAYYAQGFVPHPQEHGGFSITVFDSIISFDYIRIYR